MRKDWDLWTALSVFCFMTTAFTVLDILFHISINPRCFILSFACLLLCDGEAETGGPTAADASEIFSSGC